MRFPPLVSTNMYHIYNRGVSKRKIFLKETDYRFFMFKISLLKNKYSINMITYCLMPNHFHFLLYTQEKTKNIAKFMAALQCSYAKYFNHYYKHSGHVFQGTYKNRLITADEMPTLIDYIEQNPVKEKLAKHKEDWPYRG